MCVFPAVWIHLLVQGGRSAAKPPLPNASHLPVQVPEETARGWKIYCITVTFILLLAFACLLHESERARQHDTLYWYEACGKNRYLDSRDIDFQSVQWCVVFPFPVLFGKGPETPEPGSEARPTSKLDLYLVNRAGFRKWWWHCWKENHICDRNMLPYGYRTLLRWSNVSCSTLL